MSTPPGPVAATTTPAAAARAGTASRFERLSGLASYLFLAVVCFVPQLLTHPGVVSDDTKTYLYLDPGTLMRQAPTMWNPNIALGTVTHQNIGYLLPMGPFFWLFSVAHAPIWVAQRLWAGTILFAAAAGVLYLSRLLGVTGVGRVVAALAYGLSPYVMQYLGRISVILLPFSGLPWLLAFMILAVRHRGWRYPAAFALVVTLVSGINASSIVYVGIAPLLWLPYAVFVTREISGRQAWGVFVRTGILTLLSSLWWIAGLSVEGLYGVDILKYTETVEATSSAATASEVIRGLGYWYFYGGDRLRLWTQSSIGLTTNVGLLALSYAVPVGAFVAAAIIRWRERAFFALLVAIGLLLSVGPHPFQSPTPLGALDKAFMTHTTVGLALRSTDRATPVVMLGLAVLVGAGISAIARRLPLVGLGTGLLAGAVVLAANAPLTLDGDSVIPQFSQPATLPGYVQAAARYLNSTAPGTRVYALPGNDFAAYRWGDTIDPVWAGILDRPFVTHEQFIQGSIPTANLLYALDNPLQQGTFDFSALAPIARLMSVGDVLVQYDEQYERYDSPRPALLEQELASVPPGLSRPVSFGAPTMNVSELPMLDETYFDTPPAVPHAPLSVYAVANPRPIVRGESLAGTLVIAGDNVGLVEAANAGLLAGSPAILFAGTLDGDPALASIIAAQSPHLVLTDSNRKRAFEWNSLSENTGYTETPSEGVTAFTVNDPGFDLFPGAGTSSETTSVLTGISSVSASAYGTAFTLRPEFRPANAIDHSLSTAWETEGTAQAPAVSQWWQVTLDHKVTADSVTLTQPQPTRNAEWLTNQWITKATLTFDGGSPVTVSLGPESRGPTGQTVVFPRRTFETMRVRIDRTNLSDGGPPPVGSSLVGFADIKVGNIATTQIVALPTDLLNRYGASSLNDQLTILLSRERVAPVPPRSDPELAMIRQFRLPTARSFSVSGIAHLSDLVADPTIDSLVGRSNPLVVSAWSSSRIPGNAAATASATLDGNASTAWSPGLGAGANEGSWLSYRFRHPMSVSHLSLQIVSDAEHSVPTTILVTAGGVTRTVSLGHIPTTGGPRSATTVRVAFPPVRGDILRLTFTGITIRNTLSYETSLITALPIAVAGVSIPGVPLDRLPPSIPTRCSPSLLRVDGRPVWLSVTGSASGALAGGPLRIATCGPDRSGITLGAGTHLLQAADGAVSGLNLDSLALDSAPGGAALVAAGAGALLTGGAGALLTGGAGQAAPPLVRVLHQSSSSISLEVTGAHRPFLLVLGESLNKGWQATEPGVGSLGSPVLVDGFANGWLVSARDLAAATKSGTFHVTLSFAPQQEVNLALVASALAVLACLAILVVSLAGSRRRRRRREAGDQPSLVWPFEAVPSRHRPTVVALGVVLGTVLGLAAGGVAASLAAALGALVALTWSRGRHMLAIGAAVVMIAAAAEVVRHEYVNRYLPGAGWPSHFSLAATMVLVAVVMLAADACRDLLGRARGSRPSPESSGRTIPGSGEGGG